VVLLRPRATRDGARRHARAIRRAAAFGPVLRCRPDRVRTDAAGRLLSAGGVVRELLCGTAPVAQCCHLSSPRGPVRTLRPATAAVFVLSLVVFWPTLRNGFLPLGFDDALILDTPALRGLGWENLRSLATQYNHAHFVPVTLLSLAIDYHFWGLDPLGYHLMN